ncbi:bifunctional peptidase and arginyl-hydroxylase JMJD5-like [Octopus sinensis]|uniref:Bifunctional peptidase and arginyl-hydroxylase JMJD5-like n=1 Tax=Octopus sinensis TaxID=2607531 RepID=A0A6P7SCW7_9MOLL|nr:bifunctional peptidase and arginyl-hydroxylase JMJD5-like [Octopus sinensis]XP_036358294.1 bifunctional peptidase and arginyl-hydroxylase JMJD5-like [Octopus sinensis]
MGFAQFLKVCLFVMFNINCSLVYARISFQKDQRMDYVFPPLIEKSVDSRIPEGHLRPLGFQRHPDGKVQETKGMPSPESFYKYIQDNQPVMMSGAMKNVPIAKTWEKDDYLKEKYGNISVPVSVRKQQFPGQVRIVQMKFKKFLLEYMYEDWYLATTIPLQMASELTIPQCLSCGSYFHRLLESELWISSGFANTQLHSHSDHILHCLQFGRRDFILMKKEYKKNFEFVEEYPTSISGHSPLDMNKINMFKHTNFAKTPWVYASLYGGDCLYIPAEYLHQVRSYGRAISYTIHFSPSTQFDLRGCFGDEVQKTFKLTDANFLWTFTGGHKQLSNLKFSPESFQKLLQLLLGAGDRLSFHQFEHFYDMALKQDNKRPPALEVFWKMAKKDKDYMTRHEIDNFSPDKLMVVVKVLNSRFSKKKDEL